jgi:hypothetical protein
MFNRISVANFVLLVFLALRNTPLAPLSGRSYEKLRPLHKTAGYTCIVTSVLHAIVYLSAWAQANELESMREKANIAGGIAGLAMVIIGFSTIGWLVRRYYECASEDQLITSGIKLTDRHFQSVLHYSCGDVHVNRDSSRNAPTGFCEIHGSYRHLHSLSVEFGSSLPFCQALLEFLWQLRNTYSLGTRSGSGEASPHPPLFPWVPRLFVDAINSLF